VSRPPRDRTPSTAAPATSAKRILVAVAATITALLLLFSYRTSRGDAVVALPGSVAKVASSGQAGAASGSGPATAGADPPQRAGDTEASGPSSSGSSGPSGAATVVNGPVEQTPYGPVQVQVTVAGGRITQVTVLQQPTDARRSQEINAFALPQLRSETLAAQSARIDAVSGATYTTEGYQASLQSALDAAHRAA
jgi:hypothetical protein